VAFYDRDSDIRAYVKIRAHGKCDLCQTPAPFTDEAGHPYLEAHHIKWLAKGGLDIPENMVALCPNCHRKMHVLDLEEDRTKLEDKAKRYPL
jgi:5-methylcytosine-specific restriction protein A